MRVPLRRSNDDDEPYILIHVQSTSANALDLNLTSTDNRAIFSTNMKHDQVANSQADQKNGDPGLWEAALRWVLLRQPPEKRYIHVMDNFELQAAVETSRKITMTVRQSIGGITVGRYQSSQQQC